jgi:hypothetical protein
VIITRHTEELSVPVNQNMKALMISGCEQCFNVINKSEKKFRFTFFQSMEQYLPEPGLI